MRTAILLLAAIVANVTPAYANHPGDRLDEVMAEKEPAFEPRDLWRLPDAELATATGSPLGLGDLEDRIVVLSFVPEGCSAPCAAQQALLAQVQASVNITPMREMVLFLTVAPSGAEVPGWETVNWLLATPQGAASVGRIAGAFAALSARADDTPMAHLIDRGGRHAGIFHGSGFGHVNMVLYINGLSNERPLEPGLLDRLFRVFR